ncbi:hypothetical protein Tco_1143408 [Tanacetum coccineum]
MSNTNNNLQTQKSNALCNAIMEAVGKDRPQMLAPVVEGSSKTTIKGYIENYKNVSQEIRNQLDVEAVQIILIGIDNDIYSTVDACPNACEMWKAIERLKQGESINVQDLETNLYWEFGKFTSRDGKSLESYYSRFYKMMNELVRNQCDVTNHQVNVQFLLQLQPEWQRFVTLVKQSQELKIVSYHKLYDILKQLQNEVNEIRAKILARTANPLALDQEPIMVAEDDEMLKEKEIDKLMALISLSFKKIYKPTNNNIKTLSKTSRANQDNSPRINRGIWACSKGMSKTETGKDTTYHKEKMLLCKQEEAGFQLNAEQADWRDDTDDEPDDQELEAHYQYIAKIQEQPESVNDTYLEEQCDTNITLDSLDMSTNEETVDQDDNDLARERKIEDFKTKNKSLESSNNHFKEENNELSKTNQLMFKDLKKFQAKLNRYPDVNYASKVETGCGKAKGDLMSYNMESEKSFNEYNQKLNDFRNAKGACCTTRNHLHNVTRKRGLKKVSQNS